MSLDRLKLIEKAFSLEWCQSNLVLVDSLVRKKDDADYITVFVSDLDHLPVLGKFISDRLQSTSNLNAEFETAGKEEIAKVLNHLKLLQQKQQKSEINSEENKKNKPQVLADEGIMIQPYDEADEEQMTETDNIELSLKFSFLGVLGWGSIALTILSCFAPLVKIPVIGSINYLYGGRGDGVIVIICSLVAPWFLLQSKLQLMRYTASFSLTVISFTFWTFLIKIIDFQHSIADNPFRGFVNVGLEIGWVLIFLGPIGLLFRSFIRMNGKGATLSRKELKLVFQYIFVSSFAGLASSILFHTFNTIFGGGAYSTDGW